MAFIYFLKLKLNEWLWVRPACTSAPYSLPAQLLFRWTLLQVRSLARSWRVAFPIILYVPLPLLLLSAHGPTLSYPLTFLVSLVQYHQSLIFLLFTPFSLLWESLHIAGLSNSVPVNQHNIKKSPNVSWAWPSFHVTTPTNAHASKRQ